MWQVKTFSAKSPTLEALAEAQERAEAWRVQNEHCYQLVQVFINNGYAFDYRPLRKGGQA